MSAPIRTARADTASAWAGGEIAIEAQNAEAGSEALFGMGAVGQDGGNQRLGVRADGRRPAEEAIWCPLCIAAVAARH